MFLKKKNHYLNDEEENEVNILKRVAIVINRVMRDIKSRRYI